MTKTENYQLPQWEPHDPVRRTDFNAAMGSIDTALQAAEDAQSSADTALAAFTIGTYTGNGIDFAKGGLDVELGFRPRFLIITRGWSYSNLPVTTVMAGTYIPEGVQLLLAITDTGFRVGQYQSSGNGYLKLNTADTVYNFIAFR